MLNQNNLLTLPSGKPINLISSTPLETMILPYLFIGGVHGDEPEGILLAENLIRFIKNKNYKCDWAIIPCLNPDGAVKNQRVNSNGVDLNRNFPSSDWTSTDKKDRYYPGPSPGSELETQTAVKIIQKMNPKVIFHFHSWKPEIILTGTNCTEAQIFSNTSGYPLKHDIGYPTPGSLGQYGWFDLGIPVICIEEAEKEPAQTSWDRFEPAFKKILVLPE